MNSIKIVLIICTVLSAIVASVALPSRLTYRLLAAVFFAAATGLIAFPDTSTVVAHILGVGRGTDLLLYLGIFAGVHAFLLLYARTRKLERKIAEMVRNQSNRQRARVWDNASARRRSIPARRGYSLVCTHMQTMRVIEFGHVTPLR